MESALGIVARCAVLLTCHNDDLALGSGAVGVGCDLLELGDVFECALVCHWADQLLAERSQSSLGGRRRHGTVMGIQRGRQQGKLALEERIERGDRKRRDNEAREEVLYGTELSVHTVASCYWRAPPSMRGDGSSPGSAESGSM